MADLNAKDGSQETMVNLLALLINLTLLPWLSTYPGQVELSIVSFDNYLAEKELLHEMH